MAIDFNGLNSNQIASQRGRAVDAKRNDNAAAKPDAAPTQAPAKGENLVLSPEARALQAIEQDLRSQSGIDDDKVSRIKAAIDSGAYQVDAKKLAQKMLDVEKSIFG